MVNIITSDLSLGPLDGWLILKLYGALQTPALFALLSE